MPKTGKESQAAGGYRITRGCFEDGESFVLSDYWKASRRPSRSLEKDGEEALSLLKDLVRRAERLTAWQGGSHHAARETSDQNHSNK